MPDQLALAFVQAFVAQGVAASWTGSVVGFYPETLDAGVPGAWTDDERLLRKDFEGAPKQWKLGVPTHVVIRLAITTASI